MHLEFDSQQIMSKVKNSIPQTQSFLIVRSIILFSLVEPTTVISDRMALVAVIKLAVAQVLC